MYDIRKDKTDIVDEIINMEPGIPYGIRALDEYLVGADKGELIVIAGRPGMGKSSLIRTIALSMSNTVTAMFFMMEDVGRLRKLLLCNLAKVNFKSAKRGVLTDKEQSRLNKCQPLLKERKLLCEEDSRITPGDIQRYLEEYSKQEEIGCVFIDYLQLMTMDTGANRQEEVSAITRELKCIATDFQVPVIAASQLNRQSESREDLRPRMSDLRESGSIEQDANTVLLLHRQSYYDLQRYRNAEDNGEAEIIIGKSRCGDTGIVKCAFLAEYMQFVDIPEELKADEEF